MEDTQIAQTPELGKALGPGGDEALKVSDRRRIWPLVDEHTPQAVIDEIKSTPGAIVEVKDEQTIRERFLEDNKKVISELRLHVGAFLEINHVCYRVRKITPKDVVLRRFSGTLVMPKVHATATQLKGARPA